MPIFISLDQAKWAYQILSSCRNKTLLYPKYIRSRAIILWNEWARQKKEACFGSAVSTNLNAESSEASEFSSFDALQSGQFPNER